MSEISIVGSYFKDNITVLYNNKLTQIERPGGIYNLDIDNANYYMTDFNESSEVINKFGRDGVVTKWSEGWSGIEQVKWELRDTHSKWMHFSYLNTIWDLKVSEFKANMKSCDLSTSWRPGVKKEDVLQNISECEIMFASTEFMAQPDAEDYLKASNVAVIHGSGRSWVVTRGATLGVYPYQEENFIYTLGAGDKFAGYFIESYLAGRGYRDSLESAHQRTLSWLVSVNREFTS